MVGPGAAGASKPGNLPVADPGTVGPGVVAGGIPGARGAGATGGAGAGAAAGGSAGGGVMAGIVEGSRADAGGSGKTRIRAGKRRQRLNICMCYPLNSSKRCLIDRTGRIKTAEKKVLTTATAATLLPVGAAKGTAYKYERAIRATDDTAKLIRFSLDEKLHQEK
ncbi:hypothetical protein [Nitrosospira multiformis]|uniref:hypothetical protein n=1 Tax=Nitrosospira multiformis TaxID=1231 RepID=UPI000944D7F1|nr:hypothetical protein [Nitrosospira multiformis]